MNPGAAGLVEAICSPSSAWSNERERTTSCCYLAAPSGKYITGEVMTIDGGGRLWGELWTAGRPEYFNP